MLLSESVVLRAVDRDQHWPEWVVGARDVPGAYLHLVVQSLRRRGLVRRTWRGGYRLTKNGREYLLVSVRDTAKEQS